MVGLIMDLAGMLNQFSGIESQYINISNYRSFPGSFYMVVPVELKSLRKGLINIKNKDQKCFYGIMLEVFIIQKNIQKEF